MSQTHGHSQQEIEDRIANPPGRGLLRDVVYGGIDGSVTTFAIVAGVAGAGLSPFVIVALGIANVLADGFSMAAGNYSATRTELEDMERLREVERRHIELVPDGEREEIRQILHKKGLQGETLERAVYDISNNEQAWIDLMLVEEYGLSPANPRPFKAAMATFLAFLVCGLVPLLPFVFGISAPFQVSTVMTMFRSSAMDPSPETRLWVRSSLRMRCVIERSIFSLLNGMSAR